MQKRLLVAVAILMNALVLGFLGMDALRASLLKPYPFLSPRIFAENPNDIIINFTALRSELREFVGAERDFDVGVYFEYLPSGVSIGVNEKKEFISASLLKTPFVMGIYKRIETKALAPDDVLTLREQHLDRNFGTLWKRGVGAELTVEEAIALALQQSDNTAVLAMDALMPTDVIREVYNALDIPVVLESDQPTVSAKNASSVYRCLYLSCYLSYKSSEKILALLTETIFPNGISAGVPSRVRVAHKVGIYDDVGNGTRMRSDCGIVYVPRRPYILCIMANIHERQEKEIIDFMREVSGMVYAFVTGL